MEIKLFATALKKGEVAADYIENSLLRAKSDLTSFTHTPILEELMKSPDGVKTLIFKGVKNEGVNLAEPKEVAVAMKSTQAIIYHHPSAEYRLASKKYRTALLN